MAPSSKKKRGATKCPETALPESVSLNEEKQKSFETKLKRIKQNVSMNILPISEILKFLFFIQF